MTGGNREDLSPSEHVVGPGVWSNSFCGHPGPGENPENAVRRGTERELGMTVDGLRIVLPDFRFEARDTSEIVENEFRPVWATTATSDVRPVPDEVGEWRWIEWQVLVDTVAAAPFLFSPWLQEQVPLLASAPGRADGHLSHPRMAL